MWGLRSKGVESWEVGVCVATEPLWEAFHNGSVATHRRSREQKAARRRRQGMAVCPHPPAAAAKQSASRARKQQAAQALAARECATIQQALRTRVEQSWELAELIDACSRDPDMPHQVPEGLSFPNIHST